MPGIFYFGISLDIRIFNITDGGTRQGRKTLDEKFMQAHTFTKINPKTPAIFNIPKVKAEVVYEAIALLDG